MAYKKVSGIVFHTDREYILVEIINGLYSPPMPPNDINEKYDPLIAIIKGFDDRFDRHLTCWDHLIKYNDCNYYSILTDLEKIECDDNHDIIHISDIISMDCAPELKWLVFMALDKNIINKKITNI